MKAAGSKTLDVIVLDNTWLETDSSALLPQRTVSNVRSDMTRSRQWGVSVGAAILTAAVHLLMIGPLLLGNASRKLRSPPIEGLAASALKGEASEMAATYIVVNDDSISAPDRQDDSARAVLTEAEPLISDALLSISVDMPAAPQLSSIEESSEESATSDESAGNAAQATMMFGRYMGQIKARIERAWTQPERAARSGFQCTVQIKQSKTGAVREVTLQRCDTDPQWQVSLVRAIQMASPLSAPPSEKLFVDEVTLSFAARGEASGSGL